MRKQSDLVLVVTYRRRNHCRLAGMSLNLNENQQAGSCQHSCKNNTPILISIERGEARDESLDGWAGGPVGPIYQGFDKCPRTDPAQLMQISYDIRVQSESQCDIYCCGNSVAKNKSLWNQLAS